MPHIAVLQFVLPVFISSGIVQYHDLAICYSKEATVVFRGTSVDYAVSGLAFEQLLPGELRPQVNRVGRCDKQALIER